MRQRRTICGSPIIGSRGPVTKNLVRGKNGPGGPLLVDKIWSGGPNLVAKIGPAQPKMVRCRKFAECIVIPLAASGTATL